MNHFNNSTFQQFNISTFLLATLLLVGCQGQTSDPSRQVARSVEDFVSSYYNWQYHQALRYVTPESERWLSFMASQVQESDLEELRKQEQAPTFQIDSIAMHPDSTALAIVTVSNFLQADSFGQPPTLREQATIHLNLVYSRQKQNWLVDLQTLP